MSGLFLRLFSFEKFTKDWWPAHVVRSNINLCLIKQPLLGNIQTRTDVDFLEFTWRWYNYPTEMLLPWINKAKYHTWFVNWEFSNFTWLIANDVIGSSSRWQILSSSPALLFSELTVASRTLSWTFSRIQLLLLFAQKLSSI